MVVDITKDELEKIKKEHSVIVLDFYATWCGPCIASKPEFEKIAEKYKSKAFFGKVNVDIARDLAVEYKTSSIPTVIVLKNGTPVLTHLGSFDAQTLSKKLETVL